MMKKTIQLILASILGGMITLGSYFLLFPQFGIIKETQPQANRKFEAIPAVYTGGDRAEAAENTDFTVIAESTVNAVVHVKNVSVAPSNPLMEFFYGSSAPGGQMVVGAGSGVIISPDGYIITNNHVINGAKKIEVTLNNKKTYEAEIVGVDKTSDIALLKINAGDLPSLGFGDSDNLKVGEWVLAVGNPFNLNSTVTAGIISAKSRDLNKRDGKNESYIQTDAAVNRGNSGGALVNTNGELIGINTAISSMTGGFVGYSFAVPSNVARKIFEDIIEFKENAPSNINFLITNGLGHNKVYKTAEVMDQIMAFLAPSK